jgi:hypothetical protein
MVMSLIPVSENRARFVGGGGFRSGGGGGEFEDGFGRSLRR